MIGKKNVLNYLLGLCLLTSVSCKNDDQVSTSTLITGLACSSATFSSTPVINTVFAGTAAVSYAGGNGSDYAAGTGIASTGVTGLTATLQAGTLASGDGTLTYSITGTPTASGVASFAITFGGQSCTLELTVGSTAASTDCDGETGVAKVVCLAQAFKATLSSSQIATLQLDYTFTNAKKWSNLPAAMSARNGIKLGSLNTAQLAAAKALIKEMTGTVANEGYDEVNQVWLADDWLVSDGNAGSDYGSGNYYLAFLGTPSMTGTFEILETGHHKTVANTYVNGVLVGATPHFEAVEPISWTSNGTTYAPISQERDTFVNFLGSLSGTQLSSAKSSSTFTDLLLVPGKEWQFPTTRTGLQCNGLSADQKALLLNVIKTYTNDIDAADAAAFLTLYTNELADTYVLYSGTTAMTTQNDYFRIDGPHVWIELIIAGGVVYRNSTHIHSIWRDRSTDYAGTKN